MIRGFVPHSIKMIKQMSACHDMCETLLFFFGLAPAGEFLREPSHPHQYQHSCLHPDLLHDLSARLVPPRSLRNPRLSYRVPDEMQVQLASFVQRYRFLVSSVFP